MIIYSPKLDTCVVSISTYIGDPADGFVMTMKDVLTGASLDCMLGESANAMAPTITNVS